MKFIAICITALVTLLGGTSAFAATPEDCAESDDVPIGVECPDEGAAYPIELPEEGTVPDPTTTTTTVAAPEPTVPPTGLPATGGGGSTGLMQIAGLMLAGGLLIWVAARRRNPAPTA